jgi:hypothetical protein
VLRSFVLCSRLPFRSALSRAFSLLRQCSAPPPPDVLIRVCDLILRPSVQSPVAPRILALQASDVAVRLSFSLLSCFCCHGSSAGRVGVSAAAASIGFFFRAYWLQNSLESSFPSVFLDLSGYTILGSSTNKAEIFIFLLLRWSCLGISECWLALSI